jgi:hypothetical protein
MLDFAPLHQMPGSRPGRVAIQKRSYDTPADEAGKGLVVRLRFPFGDHLIA